MTASVLLAVLAAVPMLGKAQLAAAEAMPPLAGKTLTDALLELERRGLALVFTSEVVDPSWRVPDEPGSGPARAVLAELLAPWGLQADEGPLGRLVIVRASPGGPARIEGRVRLARSDTRLPGVEIELPVIGASTTSDAEGRFHFDGIPAGMRELRARSQGFESRRRTLNLAAGETATIELVMELEPLSLEEVVVSPSARTLLVQEPIGALSLEHDQLRALAGSDRDALGSMSILPGAVTDDLSARLQIRGGRADELLVMIDGVEIYEPYHLRDFGRPLSLLDPTAVARMELVTGAFASEYGDRMGGVLDVTTRTPSRAQHFLGLGRLRLEAGTSGTFSEGRGRWLSTARFGRADRAAAVYETPRDPHFSDLFAKVDRELGARHSLRLQGLASEDGLRNEDQGADPRPEYTSRDYNSTFWLSEQSALSERLWVDSTLSWAPLRRRRQGFGGGETAGFVVDEREMSAVAIGQDWLRRGGESQLLKWGFRVQHQDVDYDYESLVVNRDPLAVVLRPPQSVALFDRHLDGQQNAVYLADRFRAGGAVTAEIGARWDASTVIEESHVSPRLNLAWAVRGASVLRAGWGHYYQSQRPYEIQVEDGLEDFLPDERAEHRIVGFEHLFRGGQRLRLEAYERLIEEPRLRFENLFDPVSLFPESEPDRVALMPESGRARGVEVSTSGRRGSFEWFASYAWSRAQEVIDGMEVARNIDERSAVALSGTWRPGRRWSLSAVWRYHSGWPTTTVKASLVHGEIVPELGPLYAERLPPYHRLDLRAARFWRPALGEISLALELENAYDRANVRGYDFDYLLSGGDTVAVVPLEKDWAGFYPAFSLRWEF